jgi:hypothetical protein
MPLNISYMGTKRRLASAVAEVVALAPSGPVLDLFSGMCAVASELTPVRQVWCNDVQRFAADVASGLSRRVTHRATVDFPDPESPTSANVCPRGMLKSTPLTAATGTRFRHRPPRTYCLRSPLTRSKL